MNVTAIVITYNRKYLLEKCLTKLLQQSKALEKILIVDNASTDGTVEYIQKKFHQDHIEILRLAKNIGGAGGFYEGMKYAKKDKNSLLWLMDDDGYPEQTCLEQLLKYMVLKQLDALSPIQIDINNEQELAFPVTYQNKKITGYYSNLRGVEYIQNEANLFNGLLISKKTVEQIGLPIVELFIRGDEVEYTKRMKGHKLLFGTLVNAKFFHPSDKEERIKIFFNLMTIRDAHSDFKNYYMFRNRAVAFIKDGNSWLIPLDFLRYIYYYLLIKKLKFQDLFLWCKATKDGIRNKLGRHPNY